MNNAMKMLAAAAASMLLASTAQAGAAFYGGRVGGVDVPKLAKFYDTVFGLKETNRIEMPGLFEIIMNFGDSADAAKKNKSPPIILIRRETDDIKDTVPHLILTVTDMAATVAAVKSAGGKIERDPQPFGQITLAFIVDPAGNHIELIQLPKG